MDWTKSWAWGFCSAQLLLCIQGALTAKAINILEFARTKQSNRQLHLWIVSPKPKVVFYSKVLQESVNNMMLLLFLFSWEDKHVCFLIYERFFQISDFFLIATSSWYFSLLELKRKWKEKLTRKKKNDFSELHIELASKECLSQKGPQFAAVHSHCMQTSSCICCLTHWFLCTTQMMWSNHKPMSICAKFIKALSHWSVSKQDEQIWELH